MHRHTPIIAIHIMYSIQFLDNWLLYVHDITLSTLPHLNMWRRTSMKYHKMPYATISPVKLKICRFLQFQISFNILYVENIEQTRLKPL